MGSDLPQASMIILRVAKKLFGLPVDDGRPVWANAHVPPVGSKFTEGACEEWFAPDHSISQSSKLKTINHYYYHAT